MLQFNWTNTETGQTEHLRFSLGNWRSWKAYNEWTEGNGQPSGDYIFRPATGQYEPDTYSNYSNVACYMNNSSPYDMMSFYFRDQNHGNDHLSEKYATENVIVHVSIDADLKVLRFDVDMDSLPPIRLDGYEVIVDFTLENFDNNGTFWTDSNELEMQKRILNYRPTWNLTAKNYEDSLENVTANYYPINSAISMQEVGGDRQFTVMNDRSQAGSALHNGGIQFMQNRRIPNDDHRGMGEWLDEKNAYGNGIRVPATYFVDIFRNKDGKSSQRLVQNKQDDPVHAFFNFNGVTSGKGKASSFSDSIKAQGVSNMVKYVVLPTGKNELLFRFENLADLYDKEAQTAKVNIEGVFKAFYAEANNNLLPESLDFEEMSLTGNMPLKELRERKIQWKTVDDHKLVKKTLDIEDGPIIKLEPQRIRVFKVTFTSASELFLTA